MPMDSISSGHYSVDTQMQDALDFLRLNHVEVYCEIRKNFSETFIWEGSWLDTEAMDVDPDYGSWLIDAIEDTGIIQWIDGEPYDVSEMTDEDWEEME